MRPRVWIVRIGFLVVAAILGVGAVQARQSDDLHGEAGLTGQRQPIEFELNQNGTPQAFATAIYLQCSGGREWRLTWAPADGDPVDFEWDGDAMSVVEETSEDYGSKGGSSSTTASMTARLTPGGAEGHMRMIWRVDRPGEEAVCDSGNVPFALGPAAARRIAAMRPAARPWIAYPEGSAPAAPGSTRMQRWLMRADATCLQWWEHRPQDAPFDEYLRWHEAELGALRTLGAPPEGRDAHRAWLRNFEQRVELERNQLEALAGADLAAAARIRAANSQLKAEGNAAGLRLGLRSCVSNGPAGAPRF